MGGYLNWNTPRSSTRIQDFYASGDEFELMAKRAIRECPETNTRGLDFLIELEDKWEKHGMRAWMTKAQNNFLRRLAGLSEEE